MLELMGLIMVLDQVSDVQGLILLDLKIYDHQLEAAFIGFGNIEKSDADIISFFAAIFTEDDVIFPDYTPEGLDGLGPVGVI